MLQVSLRASHGAQWQIPLPSLDSRADAAEAMGAIVGTPAPETLDISKLHEGQKVPTLQFAPTPEEHLIQHASARHIRAQASSVHKVHILMSKCAYSN